MISAVGTIHPLQFIEQFQTLNNSECFNFRKTSQKGRPIMVLYFLAGKRGGMTLTQCNLQTGNAEGGGMALKRISNAICKLISAVVRDILAHHK